MNKIPVPKSPKGQTKRRRIVWLLMLALMVGLGIWWWKDRPAPMVGSGQPPGLVARAFLQRGFAAISPADEAGYTRLNLDHPDGWLGLFPEPVQSIEAYQHQDPIRPSGARRTIVIQPLGSMNEEQRRNGLQTEALWLDKRLARWKQIAAREAKEPN